MIRRSKGFVRTARTVPTTPVTSRWAAVPSPAAAAAAALATVDHSRVIRSASSVCMSGHER